MSFLTKKKNPKGTGRRFCLKSVLTAAFLGCCSLVQAAAEEVPQVTEPPQDVKPGPNWTPFIIVGVILGLVLAIVLAVRKANKIYGKGWD